MILGNNGAPISSSRENDIKIAMDTSLGKLELTYVCDSNHVVTDMNGTLTSTQKEVKSFAFEKTPQTYTLFEALLTEHGRAENADRNQQLAEIMANTAASYAMAFCLFVCGLAHKVPGSYKTKVNTTQPIKKGGFDIVTFIDKMAVVVSVPLAMWDFCNFEEKESTDYAETNPSDVSQAIEEYLRREKEWI